MSCTVRTTAIVPVGAKTFRQDNMIERTEHEMIWFSVKLQEDQLSEDENMNNTRQ